MTEERASLDVTLYGLTTHSVTHGTDSLHRQEEIELSARNTSLAWDTIRDTPALSDHAKIGLLALAEIAADQEGLSAIMGDGLLRLQNLTGWTVEEVEEFYLAFTGAEEIIGPWSGTHFDMAEACIRIVGWKR